MSFKFLQRRHGCSGLSPEGGSYSRLPASLDWFDVEPLHLHQSAFWKTAIRATEPATLCQQSLMILCQTGSCLAFPAQAMYELLDTLSAC